MARYSVTAVGGDRPGIVAALTGALFEMGCNLEDVASTILRGSFAITVVVAAPDAVDAGELERRVGAATSELDVGVSVREVHVAPGERPEATHVLVVYGSDRPGIVARLTRLLADRGANITDLSCRLTGDVYSMVAEVALAEDADPDDTAEAVHAVAGEIGVDVTFHAVEVETL
jgi:glycine cleavage system transcriptional repressor